MPKYEFTVIANMTLTEAEKLLDFLLTMLSVTTDFAAFHEVKPDDTEVSDDTQNSRS